MTSLNDAVEIAVGGGFPESSSSIDGHKFYIRSVRNKNRLTGNETSYFRHEHIGKDDRVFYEIDLGNQRGQYTARMTRIELRGPMAQNGFTEIPNGGIDVTTAAAALGATWKADWPQLYEIIQGLNVQFILDGNWLPAAAKVIDTIGKRMAEDLPA